jgi:hypothetical protein
MSKFIKAANDAADQYLTTLAEGQETFLKGISAATSWTPPALPAAFTSKLPTVQEINQASFAFAEKLLKHQKEFAEKLFATSAPAPVTSPQA